MAPASKMGVWMNHSHHLLHLETRSWQLHLGLTFRYIFAGGICRSFVKVGFCKRAGHTVHEPRNFIGDGPSSTVNPQFSNCMRYLKRSHV